MEINKTKVYLCHHRFTCANVDKEFCIPVGGSGTCTHYTFKDYGKDKFKEVKNAKT